MTAAEMKTEFNILYDKIANSSAPGYLDDEISMFLTLAQERVVKHRYSFLGNKYQDSFDETEKRKKELQALLQPSVDSTGVLKTTVSSNQTAITLPNGVIYDLPSDLWLPVTEWVISTSCEEIRDVIPVTHDEIILQRNNPFLSPNKRKVWRKDAPSFNNIFRSEIISNGDPITEYHVQYLKKPSAIVVGTNPVNCELHDMIHRDIISEAVNVALETVQEQRFQTQSIINNNVE